jgi:hypothetical protein
MPRNYFGSATRSAGKCIFISHSSLDKPFARLVAAAIGSMGVDVYFDEADICIRSRPGDAGLVGCIQTGIDNSTHLLGLITRNTKESWWVPFEIGGAMGQRKDCAHLIARDVTSAPAYIKVSQILADQDDLANWVAKIRGEGKTALFESLKKSAEYGSARGLDSLLPQIRSTANISFY